MSSVYGPGGGGYAGRARSATRQAPIKPAQTKRDDLRPAIAAKAPDAPKPAAVRRPPPKAPAPTDAHGNRRSSASQEVITRQHAAAERLQVCASHVMSITQCGTLCITLLMRVLVVYKSTGVEFLPCLRSFHALPDDRLSSEFESCYAACTMSTQCQLEVVYSALLICQCRQCHFLTFRLNCKLAKKQLSKLNGSEIKQHL